MAPCSSIERPKKVTLFLWKWLNVVLFWSPALRRKFLTEKSKTLYESFQRTVFLFPQLTRVFVALGLLDLTLLIYSSVAKYRHTCSKYTGPVSFSTSVLLHAVFLLIQWRLPSVFRKCHLLFEGLSVLTLALTSDWITQCKWITEFGALRVTFASFYMLVVTIYFQYSTLLTVLFVLLNIYAPVVLYNDRKLFLLDVREV